MTRFQCVMATVVAIAVSTHASAQVLVPPGAVRPLPSTSRTVTAPVLAWANLYQLSDGAKLEVFLDGGMLSARFVTVNVDDLTLRVGSRIEFVRREQVQRIDAFGPDRAKWVISGVLGGALLGAVLFSFDGGQTTQQKVNGAAIGATLCGLSGAVRGSRSERRTVIYQR